MNLSRKTLIVAVAAPVAAVTLWTLGPASETGEGARVVPSIAPSRAERRDAPTTRLPPPQAVRERPRRHGPGDLAGWLAEPMGGASSPAIEDDRDDLVLRKESERPATEVAALLNEVVTPRALLCIDSALGRDPTLDGRLAVAFTLTGEPEQGSGLEGVEPLDTNEVDDAELFACIRDAVGDARVSPSAVALPERLSLTFTVHSRV